VNSQTILITGASGFIGKALVASLSNCPDLKIYSTGKTSFPDLANYIEADLIKGNFIETIKKNLQKCDVIVHLAACIDKNSDSKKILDVNCYGTSQIVDLARELNCKKIIYFSSSGVIGKPFEIPITEFHPVKPLNNYHCSKAFGELIINQSKQYDICPVIYRIPSPIGKNMPLNKILPVFINNCIENKNIFLYGKGLRKQNYIDIQDIIEAVKLAIYKNIKGVFNIASNKSYSNIELAEICIKLLNSSSKIIFNNIPDPEEDFNWTFSIDKAKSILEFCPKINIETSILDIKNRLEK